MKTTLKTLAVLAATCVASQAALTYSIDSTAQTLTVSGSCTGTADADGAVTFTAGDTAVLFQNVSGAVSEATGGAINVGIGFGGGLSISFSALAGTALDFTGSGVAVDLSALPAMTTFYAAIPATLPASGTFATSNFTADAVPEPTSGALLGLGALGLLARRKRG